MTKAKTRGSMLLALLLSALLVFAYGLMPLQRAFADPDTNCSYSVKTSSPANVTVDAFQMFKGEVDDTTNAISNVSWGPYQNEILDYLGKPIATTNATMTYGTWLYTKGFSTTDLTNVSRTAMTSANRTAFENPENALSYIIEQINNSAGVSSASAGTITGPGSFSNNFADYMHDNATDPAPSKQTAVSGTPANFSPLTEGFYLFYSYTDTDSFNPIWTPVGGTVNEGAVKDQDVLSIEKTVFDEDSNTWGKITDAGSGQKVTFHVEGKLPKNPATTAYKYTLEDTLSNGLTIYTTNNSGVILPEVRVIALDSSGNELGPVTDAFTASQVNNTLTISTDDLYDTATGGTGGWVDILQNADKIVFEYYATLNVQAVEFEGTTYSNNQAKLIYGDPNDPFETTPDTAYVATYELDILKIDKDTGKALDGAKFTVQTTDSEGNLKYVQSDGTLGDYAYEFESGNGFYPNNNANVWASGLAAIPIIDAGKYIVTETKAPAGYKLPAVPKTNVVITATKDVPNGAVTALTATADNNATIKATLGTGIVELELENEQAPVLPITGMTPDQTGTIVGIVLVAAGALALVVRNRRKAREN